MDSGSSISILFLPELIFAESFSSISNRRRSYFFDLAIVDISRKEHSAKTNAIDFTLHHERARRKYKILSAKGEFELHDGLRVVNVSIPNEYHSVGVVFKIVTRSLNQQAAGGVNGMLDGPSGYHCAHGACRFIQ